MAVRSNTGNIITNATQIGSVAATTAGGLVRHLADASKALRNKKQQEYENSLKPSKYAVAKTPEIARAVGEAEEAKREARALGKEESEVVEVDKLVGGTSSDDKVFVDSVIKKDMSEQSRELNASIYENLKYTKTLEEEAEELRAMGVL